MAEAVGERRSGGRQGALLAQYLRIKAEHRRAILLFRLGDFYEMFFEDAETASRDLDLTLTARNRGDPDEVPLCGFPAHAAQPYITRLLARGHTVAVCEQAPARARRGRRARVRRRLLSAPAGPPPAARDVCARRLPPARRGDAPEPGAAADARRRAARLAALGARPDSHADGRTARARMAPLPPPRAGGDRPAARCGRRAGGARRAARGAAGRARGHRRPRAPRGPGRGAQRRAAGRGAPRPSLPLVPPDYERRRTLVGAERFVSPTLREHEARVLGAEERLRALEMHLFEALLDTVAAHHPTLARTADALATLDALASLAEVAHRRGYVRPAITRTPTLTIRAGRHPVVEAVAGGGFVPNDARLDPEAEQLLVITGPNMGGKSTYLRQVALITLLAQMGSFVPAAEAEIGLIDRIFTRVGASDNLVGGESTFMVEMRETAHILANLTGRSLVVLDEIGRGTSTFDGISIAWAVAEHLHVAPERLTPLEALAVLARLVEMARGE